jgi:hypothetical protein
VDYFSYGEKLAVVEQGTNDPEGMGFIYSKLAEFLASDFTDIETFVGKSYYNERKIAYQTNKEISINNTSKEDRYKYDLFISYPRSTYQWVREVMLPALTEYLNDELGYNPLIFLDAKEISIGSSWNETYEEALSKSKIFLFVFSNVDIKSDYLANDLIFAETRQKNTPLNIIFPLIFKKGQGEMNLPLSMTDRQITDLSPYSSEAVNSSTKSSAQFGSVIGKLAVSISESIRALTDLDNNSINLKDNIQSEIGSLAEVYEKIRKEMPSSGKRTHLMQNVVEKMKSKASDIEYLLPSLIDSSAPGQRLAAIATLQTKPNVDYVHWLAQHVGDIEKPFIGYQAAVGLYTAARSLDNNVEVSNAINKAMENIDNSNYKDPNQISVLQSAMSELALRK